MSERITIRHSSADDLEAIRDVAALDSGHAPRGTALLGFVDGALRAVLPLDGGRALADPFHPTAELVDLMRMAADGARPASRTGLRGRLGRRRETVLVPRAA